MQEIPTPSDWDSDVRRAEGLEIGQNALRSEYQDVGGFDGVFRQLREDWPGNVDKYAVLLTVSMSDEQREANREAHTSIGDCVAEVTADVNRLADRDDIPPKDAPSYYLANVVATRVDKLEEQDNG